MQAIIYRCAGVDVHKKTIQVCIRCLDPRTGKLVVKVIRQFGTTTAELFAMACWLAEYGVTHVAMESTGVYWKPVFNLLEGRYEVLLCNAQHVKQVPGRKTDTKDCDWLCQLLQHGLLRGSFIPPRAMRELRDLTRHRSELTNDKTRVANRIHKVLEDANIKLACVATDILGASGRGMLQALMAGQTDPTELVKLARTRLKRKAQALKEALAGRFGEHHRDMLRTHWQHLTSLESMIRHLDTRIDALIASEALSPTTPVTPVQQTKPTLQEAQEETHPAAEHKEAPAASSKKELVRPLTFKAAVAALVQMWGVDVRSAENILAEIGTDMSRFPTHGHLSSWGGVCPGNNESAGKRHSGRMRKGNRWLRCALTQAAWAATHAKDSYFAAQFKRLAAKRGKKRALMAIAHAMLVTIYHMLKEQTPYQDLGVDYFEHLLGERRRKRYIRGLQALGFVVTLAKAS
jgi:transposase